MIGRPGRPWALTLLWFALMAPLSLAGTALQPRTVIPYEVFPLVMAGPAVAALICALLVPHWFPAREPAVTAGRLHRALGATALAGAAFTVVVAITTTWGPAALPAGWDPVGGVLALVIGLSVGSLLEEIGYRGVMYRALSVRLRPGIAILVNGVVFGLAHLQYFGAGLLAVLLFVLATVFLDVVMVALWTGSWRQRVGVATAFHAVVNVALALIGDPSTTLRSFLAFALATGVAAALAVVLGRRLGLGDLGPRHPGALAPGAPRPAEDPVG